MTARILGYDGRRLVVEPDGDLTEELCVKSAGRVELILDDGRRITPEQRRKIYATYRDIALWSGHYPEEIKEYSKAEFCALHGKEGFSLSDVDRTTAGEYLTYLIEFCLSNGVPCRETLLDRAEDVDAYLRLCILYRKCCVCGRKAEIHHCEGSRVGMGRDRRSVVHVGALCAALCREHHEAAHAGEAAFFERELIHGVPLDRKMCEKIGWRTEIT